MLLCMSSSVKTQNLHKDNDGIVFLSTAVIRIKLYFLVRFWFLPTAL